MDAAAARAPEEYFTAHSLSYGKIEPAKSGFINSVYLTDEYVLKVFKTDWGFRREQWFYTHFSPAFTPPLAAAGEGYLIFKRIRGQGLYHIWPELSNEQRENCVRMVAEIAKFIIKQKLPPSGVFDHPGDWEEYVVKNITDNLADFGAVIGIKDSTAARIFRGVSNNRHVLRGARVGLCYTDFHFDNLIITGEGRLYLIDYEALCPAPPDLILDTWLRMSHYPYLYANEEDHNLATAADYTNIVPWLYKYAPELFTAKISGLRVALYALMYDLNILKSYPGHDAVVERITGNLDILEKKSSQYDFM